MIGEAARCPSVPAIGCCYPDAVVPSDSASGGLEPLDEIDILAASQRREATDAPVRVSAKPHVGAVDVAAAPGPSRVPGSITVSHLLGVVPPLVHAHDAQDHVLVGTELPK